MSATRQEPRRQAGRPQYQDWHEENDPKKNKIENEIENGVKKNRYLSSTDDEVEVVDYSDEEGGILEEDIDF